MPRSSPVGTLEDKEAAAYWVLNLLYLKCMRASQVFAALEAALNVGRVSCGCPSPAVTESSLRFGCLLYTLAQDL